jgi:DNA-binding response OmpR family regulator
MRLPLSPRHYVPHLARRVLVVEDDAAIRGALLRLLTLAGFETLSASTVAGAMQHLAFRPDIVLSGLVLSDGNGLDLLSHVRRRDETAAVAVLTAGGEEAVRLAAHVRPDAIFRKPFDQTDLISWMDDPRPRAA